MSTIGQTVNYKNWDNIQLMSALADGSRSALAELYERHWFALYRVAFQKTNSHEIAEELVQDLFVDLWQKRAMLQVRQVTPYLFTALKYAVIDHIRHTVQKERFEVSHQIAHIDTSTEDLLGYNDLIASIETELQKMPAKTSEIFRLSRYDDQPIPVIAATLSLSEKTVEYHLGKALKTLRQRLTSINIQLPFISWIIQELFTDQW